MLSDGWNPLIAAAAERWHVQLTDDTTATLIGWQPRGGHMRVRTTEGRHRRIPKTMLRHLIDPTTNTPWTIKAADT